MQTSLLVKTAPAFLYDSLASYHSQVQIVCTTDAEQDETRTHPLLTRAITYKN